MSDKILEEAKKAKRLALAIETKFADSRSSAPSPADLGEHEEIPEEAMGVLPVIAGAREIEEKD